MRDQVNIDKFLADYATLIAFIGAENEKLVKDIITDAWGRAYQNGIDAGIKGMTEALVKNIAA